MAAQDDDASSRYISAFDASSDKKCIFTFTEIVDYDKSESITFINGTKTINEEENGEEYKDIFTQIRDKNLTTINKDTNINIHNTSVYKIDEAFHWFVTLGKREHPSTRNKISKYDLKRLRFRYDVKDYKKENFTKEFLLNQFYNALEDIKNRIYNPDNYIPMRLFFDPEIYPNFFENVSDSDILEYISKNIKKKIDGDHSKKNLTWGLRKSSFKGYDFIVDDGGNVKLMNDYFVIVKYGSSQPYLKHLFGKTYSKGYFSSTGKYDENGVLMKTDKQEIYHTWFDVFCANCNLT